MATKRTEVPAPEASPTPSAALDELTGAGQVVRHGDVALDLIDPDPRNPEHRSLRLDGDLLASIRTLGVLTPVLLRPNPEVPGRWWLIAGHRRVLHAQVAGMTLIPATMLPATDDLGALRRLLTENLHREDLALSEQAHLVQDFLDLGVEEKDLPTELSKSASWVRSRRALGRLAPEVQAKVDAHQGTLGDSELLAATLARPDIAARPEVVAELENAFGRPRFEEHLAGVVADVELGDAKAAMVAELTAKGIRVIPMPAYDDPKVKRLDQLTNKDEYYGPPLSEKRHAKCPGHVAWVHWQWAGGGADPKKAAHAVYGCDAWRAQGHFDRTSAGRTKGLGGTSERSTEQRRLVIANNKAAAAQRPVRLEWIRTQLLDLDLQMPIGAAQHCALVLTVGRGPDFSEERVHRELWTGDEDTQLAPLTDVDDTSALVLLTAHALAVAEAQMFEKNWWQTTWSDRRALLTRHLRFLAANGYELAPVEAAYIGTDQVPSTTPADEDFDVDDEGLDEEGVTEP